MAQSPIVPLDASFGSNLWRRQLLSVFLAIQLRKLVLLSEVLILVDFQWRKLSDSLKNMAGGKYEYRVPGRLRGAHCVLHPVGDG